MSSIFIPSSAIFYDYFQRAFFVLRATPNLFRRDGLVLCHCVLHMYSCECCEVQGVPPTFRLNRMNQTGKRRNCMGSRTITLETASRPNAKTGLRSCAAAASSIATCYHLIGVASLYCKNFNSAQLFC